MILLIVACSIDIHRLYNERKNRKIDFQPIFLRPPPRIPPNFLIRSLINLVLIVKLSRQILETNIRRHILQKGGTHSFHGTNRSKSWFPGNHGGGHVVLEKCTAEG